MTDPGRTLRGRRGVIAAAMAAAMLALGACGASANPKTSAPAKVPSGPTVTIKNFEFSPVTITVPVGATVTWVNRDVAVHDVKFASGGIALSPMLLPNTTSATWSHTFTKAGTYGYVCGIHPYMKGEVVVGA